MDKTKKNKIVAEFRKQRESKFNTGKIITDLEIINNISKVENLNSDEILKIIETAGHESNRPDLKYKNPENNPGNNYFC